MGKGKICWLPIVCDKELTLSQTTNFRPFQSFAANNFKSDENGQKFLNWVEKTVGKGEIARCEQFLFFMQCFQKVKEKMPATVTNTLSFFHNVCPLLEEKFNHLIYNEFIIY